MRDDGHTPIEDPQDIRAADRTRHTPHDGYDPVRLDGSPGANVCGRERTFGGCRIPSCNGISRRLQGYAIGCFEETIIIIGLQ